MNTGEINRIRPLKLSEFSFDILVPGHKYPFAVYEREFQPPSYYLEQFSSIAEGQKPIAFSVIRTTPQGVFLFANKLMVTLEDYKVKEEAKQGNDIILSVKLKQYKEFSTVKLIKNEDGTVTAQKERPVSEEKKAEIPKADTPKTYTVKKGDNLWNICKQQYDDGNKCREVAKANGIVNPNVIYPGQVIMLA